MSNQIDITGGARVRGLNGVITGTTGVLSSLPINVANGIPQLDSSGKILVSQLPNSVMEFLGTWNAATNTPTLANGTGNAGDVYLCNVAGTVNFGAGPIAFIVGDYVVYSGSTWERSGGAVGTVTSVAASITGNSVGLTGSPITTAGTLAFAFAGTNLQYINGAGNLTAFPTLITSIGLSMPSAFSVANSPLTANGTIAVTGAGVASQYIRGDGTLADFPSSGGGGSSVSYYLNGGTNQGTIGGTTYYEMSKTAVIGTGVDFAKSGDGLIVSFLTDANDPAQLNIPAGNWDYEIYASMSANGGTPQMYAELYKYDGTTFTLISTSANEIIYDGTALNLYTFAMAVPATTLTLTDRLAVKLYATNSGGKTTTIHTQDGHLCQVITTFSTGITALNGLTAQVQYFQTETSGTDFNISSTTATHTFNLPTASATKRGALSSADWTLFNSKADDALVVHLAGDETITGFKQFTSTYGTWVDYGISIIKGNTPASLNSGSVHIYSALGDKNLVIASSFTSFAKLQFQNTGNYTYTFPAASGTVALTSDLSSYVTLATNQTISGQKTFTDINTFSSTTTLIQGVAVKNTASITNTSGYLTINSFASGSTNSLILSSSSTNIARLSFSNTADTTYTLPSTGGTIALVGGSGVGTVTSVAALTIGTSGTDLSSTVANSTTTPVITLNVPTASATNRGALSSADWSNFNSKMQGGGLTAGKVPFATGSASLGDTNLNYNGGFFGFGTAASTYRIDVSGSINVTGNYYVNGVAVTTGGVTGTGTTNYLPKFTGASTIGNSAIYDNGGNIGINTITAAYKLEVLGPDGDWTARIKSSTTGVGYGLLIDAGVSSTDEPLRIRTATGSSSLLILKASGNLGLGVTPSAWDASWSVLQNKTSTFQNVGINTLISNNLYFGTAWKYIANGVGQLLNMNASGDYVFNTSVSGTAGANATLTPNMTLTAAGRLLLGTTTESTYLLDVNGTGRFYRNDAANVSLTIANAYINQGNLINFQQNKAGSTINAYIGHGGDSSGNFIINNGTQAITITNAGNVGIGTSSPNYSLQVNTATTTTRLQITNSTTGTLSTNGFQIIQDGNNNTLSLKPSGFMSFETANTERARITSGGNLLVGTTTDAGYKLDVNGTGRFSGALSGTSATFSSSVTATQFNVSTSGGATQIYNTGGGHTVITNATANKDINYQVSGTGGHYFTGAATFSSSVNAGGYITGTGFASSGISGGSNIWNFGTITSTTGLTLKTTQYLTVNVNGGDFKLALVN